MAGTDRAAGAGDAPSFLLEGVTLRYADICALDGVTLSVARGERVCVLGANGSGKSTLASVLAGLLAPDEGSVAIGGLRVFSPEGGADLEAYARARREVGLVFQNPDDQIVTSVVEEDVAFGPENLGVEPDEIGRRVRRELARVAMEPYAGANPARLSGGQRQRVSIAGALAMEPRALVLDEPGALLDVRGRRGVMRVMGTLREEGVTVVHVTHDMEEALAADRVIVLEGGRVALEGTPDEVFAQVGRLAALGLEPPFAARLALRLRDAGVHVPMTCDAGELRDALAPALARRPPRTAEGTDREGAAREGAPLVEARDLAYSYAAAGEHGHRALDGVGLSVPRGASVAVVGHTGSGKSTLLRLLAALEAPDGGSLSVEGVDTRTRRGRRRLHGRVGYVMQRPERQLFAETVWEDVAFGPRNQGLPAGEVERRCQRALELVGLAGRRDASPFALSGGQRRLCALAGVLAMEPRLLVLDEPTAGLDPQGRAQLRRILSAVRDEGVTLVEVTHSMEAAAACELVSVLAEGRVLLEGTPREVFAPAHAELLRAHGLGLPEALAFARGLEAAGAGPLGDPLTLDALARTLVEALAGRGAGGA